MGTQSKIRLIFFSFILQEREVVSRYVLQQNDGQPFWTGGKDHDGNNALTWTYRNTFSDITQFFSQWKCTWLSHLKQNSDIRPICSAEWLTPNPYFGPHSPAPIWLTLLPPPPVRMFVLMFNVILPGFSFIFTLQIQTLKWLIVQCLLVSDWKNYNRSQWAIQACHLDFSSSLVFTVDRGQLKKVMCAVNGISVKHFVRNQLFPIVIHSLHVWSKLWYRRDHT